MTKKDKNLDLDGIIEKLEKAYGKGTVIAGTQGKLEIERISTGSLFMDKILDGGYPMGRIVEIYGDPGSGKTTLCLHAIANAQKKYPDKKCLFVDTEHALSLKYAESIGCNLGDILLSQPDYAEQGFDVIKSVMETEKISVVVLDSVACLSPKSEIDGDIGDANIAKVARLMSQALRILTPIAEKTNTLLIFTNQIREKVGVIYGNPQTTTGGNSLRFYASLRLELKKGIVNRDDDKEAVSGVTKVKVVKSKISYPLKEAEVLIKYGKGIDIVNDIYLTLLETGKITREGSWYYFDGTKIGQGLESVYSFINDNVESLLTLCAQIEETVK